MKRLRTVHNTKYSYAEAASVCHNEVRLTPRDKSGQRLVESHVVVHPEPDVMASRTDYFGNQVISFSINEPHEELVVLAESTVEVEGSKLDQKASVEWREARERLGSDLEACQYLYESPMVRVTDGLREFAKGCFPEGQPLLEGAWVMCQRIHKEFQYEPQATNVDTLVEEAFAKRRGVCQDFAHVMIGALRSVGLAARYVSGYLESSPGMVGAEASHAWVSVYALDLGWVDFDPTNKLMPQERHVTLGWGRDYADVPPVKGVTLGGGDQTITVGVGVTAS